jgi:hypothetical protein
MLQGSCLYFFTKAPIAQVSVETSLGVKELIWGVATASSSDIHALAGTCPITAKA